ncbi:NUDIX domain-containing protein [Arenibaculum sp.]|uniref:NUDIX domain-containing protein n=1 Tax=Arenibaculum sp. TaxID=2865862 RepID=UPI002E15E186|nr:NUDIX domain-containing protein [Arenibaculum sp.]
MPDRNVDILQKKTLFQGYFRIDSYRVRHRKFDGGWSEAIEREVFERGHAAAVLPYDPDRDAVVLIEQFRVGALAAGRHPWMLEVVAGMVEEGETPEAVARREAVEEAGCRIGELVGIADFLASAGASSETIRLYCGRIDSTGAGGVFGLAEENEDIRVRAMPADEAIALLDGGTLVNAPVIIALHWLARRREELRRLWAGLPSPQSPQSP